MRGAESVWEKQRVSEKGKEWEGREWARKTKSERDTHGGLCRNFREPNSQPRRRQCKFVPDARHYTNVFITTFCQFVCVLWTRFFFRFFEPLWIGLPLFFTVARSQWFCLFIFDFVIAFKIFQRFRFNPSYLICCGDSTVCHIFRSHANGVHCVNLSQHTIVPCRPFNFQVKMKNNQRRESKT